MAFYRNILSHINGRVTHIVKVQSDHADEYITNNMSGQTVVELTDSEYDTHLPLIGSEGFVNGAFVAGAGELLDTHKARASGEIDRLAGDIRALYITAAPGQEMTYVYKANEAEAYRALNYPTPTGPLEYKWLTHEASARGMTLHQVADDILAQRDAWQTVGAQIEAARLGGKASVDAATDYATVLSQKTQALAALNALRP